MGSDQSERRSIREHEQPQHPVDLPSYLVARYPVTVAQFRAFADEARLDIGDPACLNGLANHPVSLVSFYEALGYCQWLTDTLKNAPWTPLALSQRLADGWVVTLPSEAEWEKAARGTDNRKSVV